jgi:hypothetical protein
MLSFYCNAALQNAKGKLPPPFPLTPQGVPIDDSCLFHPGQTVRSQKESLESLERQVVPGFEPGLPECLISKSGLSGYVRRVESQGKYRVLHT